MEDNKLLRLLHKDPNAGMEQLMNQYTGLVYAVVKSKLDDSYYRRQIIYKKLKADIGKVLRELCERKGIEIIEAELCPDHVHMLIRIPPKYSVSEIMGYLKGKSTLTIFERHANLKYKYGNRHFWCRGYFVDTVGKNAKKIEEYIRNQLQEDMITDQMTINEYIDPFTGEPVNKGKK